MTRWEKFKVALMALIGGGVIVFMAVKNLFKKTNKLPDMKIKFDNPNRRPDKKEASRIKEDLEKLK